MGEPRCETCRYSLDWSDDEPSLICRRRAPRPSYKPDREAFWPPVDSSDWCGEYAPKEPTCQTNPDPTTAGGASADTAPNPIAHPEPSVSPSSVMASSGTSTGIVTAPDTKRDAPAVIGAEGARSIGTELSSAPASTTAGKSASTTSTDQPAQIALLLGKLRKAVDTYSCSAMTCEDVRHVGAAIRALLASHPEAAWEELVRERDQWRAYIETQRREVCAALGIDWRGADVLLVADLKAYREEKEAAEAALAKERALVDRIRGHLTPVDPCGNSWVGNYRARDVGSWCREVDQRRAARTGAGS